MSAYYIIFVFENSMLCGEALAGLLFYCSIVHSWKGFEPVTTRVP